VFLHHKVLNSLHKLHRSLWEVYRILQVLAEVK
jgi:hypothetical protein